ncbi:MerR family DNA-binding transcriptional regulator [Pseudonocardia nigra]|uniref:MerR family DNA-binding transcriptional regulator n=1 Tax=Pseudonocardia nigra TaxID=1921578 RepID=UPI001C5F0C79|nr:MerR family DNA-binding transcriptional regulator [Pseudonocardia nigra]
MRSGELAKAGGVHVETLRYYERRGLLAEPLNPRAAVPCGDMEIRSKIAELDDKLAALSELRGSLERLLASCCDGRHGEQPCPALSPHRHPG